MVVLNTVPSGTWIKFPNRRKKFFVRNHLQTYLKIRPGFSYTDGRNYDPVRGTSLKDSSGRTYVVDSSRLVTIVAH